jgi:hypothetical protein
MLPSSRVVQLIAMARRVRGNHVCPTIADPAGFVVH